MTKPNYCFPIYSTYNNICTVVDDMITRDWASVTADLGNQIKTMLQQNGVVYNKCPQPAQTLAIKHYVIHLPKVPSHLSLFCIGKNYLTALCEESVKIPKM